MKSSYSRIEPETCLDAKPCFDPIRNDGRCVVSKIDVDGNGAEKKESIVTRVFDYALRLVA